MFIKGFYATLGALLAITVWTAGWTALVVILTGHHLAI